MTGVFFQAVVFDGVVKNCCELIVDAAQICLRVRFFAFITMAAQVVLPAAYVDCEFRKGFCIRLFIYIFNFTRN